MEKNILLCNALMKRAELSDKQTNRQTTKNKIAYINNIIKVGLPLYDQ